MKIDSATDLGAMLRKRRETLGLKQGELASMTGVDQGNLSKIERGTARATLETYLRLCTVLGITLIAEAKA